MCCWKGKMMVPFTMGHMDVAAARVRDARYSRYAQAVAAAPWAVAVRIIEIETYVKGFWCSTCHKKTECYSHIPFTALRAFAAFMGYLLVEAKARIKEAFAAFDAIED